MRRKSNGLNLIALLVMAALLSSCGLGKMVKRYDEAKMNTDNVVLENKGGKVAVNLKGTFPPKYFNKKAVMSYQPVLVYPGGETELKPLVLKGEKTPGEGTVIPYKTGGTFTYSDVIDFKPEMTSATLEVRPVAFKAKKKDVVSAAMKRAEIAARPKAVTFGTRKVGDGTINTCNKIYHDEDLVVADKPNVLKFVKGSEKDFYEKETVISRKANIYFVVDMYELNMSYKLNKDAAAKTELDSLRAFLKNGWVVKNIQINAWASPEGEESRNQGLSDKRGKTGDTYLTKFFKDYKKETAKKLKMKEKDVIMPEISFDITANGEDWEGFMSAVGASNIPDKNKIVNVVRAQSDPKMREQEIRNMTVIYKEIEENILPPLRRSEIIVNSYLPKKSDATIARLAIDKPDSLDVKELLYAATLTSDAATQYTIYKNLTKYYPTDWKGFNNVGYIALKEGKLDEARQYLDKANNLSPNNPIVINNLGALEARSKDYAKAKSYYKTAADLGVNTDYNSGILTVTEGEYKKAITQMSGKSCNYNLALAELLNGNSASATTALQCAPETPEKAYLMAIIGARTGNQNMVLENLKKAVQGQAALKAVAREDREFLKYFQNADFQALVK